MDFYVIEVPLFYSVRFVRFSILKKRKKHPETLMNKGSAKKTKHKKSCPVF